MICPQRFTRVLLRYEDANFNGFHLDTQRASKRSTAVCSSVSNTRSFGATRWCYFGYYQFLRYGQMSSDSRSKAAAEVSLLYSSSFAYAILLALVIAN